MPILLKQNQRTDISDKLGNRLALTTGTQEGTMLEVSITNRDQVSSRRLSVDLTPTQAIKLHRELGELLIDALDADRRVFEELRHALKLVPTWEDLSIEERANMAQLAVRLNIKPGLVGVPGPTTKEAHPEAEEQDV
jgi:hypothetical protein